MVPRILFKTVQSLVLQPLHRQMRGLTLGTRAMVLGSGDQVLLVRHTYAPGWMLPGGGVERGESAVAACKRELREETGIITQEEPRLFGLYLNDRQFPGDHVAFFVVRKFSMGTFQPNLEIAEARFFQVAALPRDTTPGTKRRIAEVMGDGVPAPEW